MPQQQEKWHNSAQKKATQDAASNVSSNASQRTASYQVPCSQSLYRYEAKRAGGMYERMLRVLSAGRGGAGGGGSGGNSSNDVGPGIRDVQVHQTSTGLQHTTMETELQPLGSMADLNIKIMMDSDSNLTNALGGQASIEYESQDLTTGPSEEPAPVAADGGGTGSGISIEAGHVSPDDSSVSAAMAPAVAPASLRSSEDDGGELKDVAGAAIDPIDPVGVDAPASSDTSGSTQTPQPRSSPQPERSAGPGQQGRGRSRSSDSLNGTQSSADLPPAQLPTDDPEGDEDEGDDDDDEEGEGEGEGEGEDMDDAQRHFQRYVDGEKVDALRGPGKDDEARETRRRLPVGHLEKEGTVIGCMSVFADVHIKEYIVFLSDEMIQAFLLDPGRFRSVANRTKCEIEVTRRILNRRMGRYRWLKYLIVDIRGPSYSAIDMCDKMMTLLFPPFKGRKPYGSPTVVSLFLKENAPDNTDLYFNFQRTGPSQSMFGEIPLRAPFRRTKTRPLEHTPWKAVQRRQQWGVLEPKNDRMETVMSHVYPERGGTYTTQLHHSIKWGEAAEQAVVMAKEKDMARAQMLKSRKVDSEPLYSNVFGD